jgi:hypothetical protein
MMAISMVVVLEEQCFVDHVYCKGASGETKAGESASDETVVSSEGAGVPPGLTAWHMESAKLVAGFKARQDVRSFPRIGCRRT